MSLTQQIIMVAAGVAATMITRFAPFIAFRPGKPTPGHILYLGRVLPASVFALLVVYCLRHVVALRTAAGEWALVLSTDAQAQVAAVLFTLLVHWWRKSLMWSVAAGTLCYMLLIRV